MQKQIKILLTLITVLILAVSCAKNNPNNPNNNINNGGSDGERTYTFIASEEMLSKPWTDQTKKDYFENSWKENLANQIIYKDNLYSTINGRTDENCNYYDDGQETIKTKFKYATNVVNNGKNYIGGLYYSSTAYTGYKWFIIYLNEEGAEICVNAKGTLSDDENTFPDASTEWYTTPSATYGYIKLN
ncbi:hypothetical protein [Brachyspira murdochii]|uniref:Lipoprotein n=1 Tax=Brachyspira murdochii (strain ATCC 51284 / DSM 12563 / 56-150) TaxID=526224 RepID=D5U6F2_BRAM5|nr:hypothetical protein [Brachyspira murdochii]ADG72651.1 conserved hypothetical protein [Brachyspira murdochii DSM 12563]